MKKDFGSIYKNEIAILGLINKYFWKSKIGPIISLLLPLIFMIIYKILSKDDPSFFAFGLSAYFSFSILPLLLITLPQLLVEFKISIILRKISVSSISVFKFCSILIIYYLLMAILSNLIIVCLYAAFLNNEAHYYFNLINWGRMVYCLLNIYISSISFGLMLGVLIKRNAIVQLVGFAIMIISILFAGQFVPLTVIAKNDAMRYISLFSPLTYSLGLLNNVSMVTDVNVLKTLPIANELVPLRNELLNQCVDNNIFDINHPFLIFDYTFNDKLQMVPRKNLVIYQSWQKIMNLVMPYVFSSLFLFISFKKFNWTSR